MTAKTPLPVALTGRHIRLEPLTVDHAPALWESLRPSVDDVFRWLRATPRSGEELAEVIEALLNGPDRCLGFAVVDLTTGRPVGWTTYLDIQEQHERLEIGWTWYARSHWRTATNTEAKLLLLTHAFEDLGYGRVQWKTDIRNERSQNAIARLGAQREGVLRRQVQRADGTWRDSVYFGMNIDEWPAAKARLTERLAKG
ncbi:GNAT family N-acetyltransferase [Streptacidiphilus fuscans]|uniref:GNAT family N-acetyltransferase n=1 Tax=Streptacidiphilus fuscans TaxID=2789292 RepID=A0A931FCD3_9ACTN|nr:GNAT family protein [Streptacidiphilus fuscans]MBF9068358.1 GNAT family N-acetyltransferase [Streptacidiphilus fuscans]